ncbi:site-specific integrase, partial [Acinetobacter baumannii]
LVFVRPGELRHAKWADIDLDLGTWSYTPPKTRSKTGVQHIVPLSKQVVEALIDLQPITRCSEFVFPAITTQLKPMSENTINQALRRMGYTSEQVCGHGFRASARTILEEVLGYPIEIIE